MNRSSNVFNAAPLGSGGASGFVFAKAAQVCQATYSAVLTVARGLKSNTSVAVNHTYKLVAGRKLKSSIQATASVWSKLLGYIAVPLTSTLNTSAVGYARLTKWRQKFMATAVDAGASVSAVLRKIQKVPLSASQQVQASVSVDIQRIRYQYIQINLSAIAQTSAFLSNGKILKSSITASGLCRAVLNESTASRAPMDRIGYIPVADRVAIVPKGS